MRFFIDECISTKVVYWLNGSGAHDATCPQHRRKLGVTKGMEDKDILRLAKDEGLIVVTQDQIDFTSLARDNSHHPGLIFLPAEITAEQSLKLLQKVIAELERIIASGGTFEDHAAEIDRHGKIDIYPVNSAHPKRSA